MSPADGLPRICLNMIVRDEVPNLPRCLQSLVPHIHYWVICDTGSRDHTPELIRDFFAAAGIPGELHRIRFRAFDQARNQALELCRDSPGAFEYICLVDADMELESVEPGFRATLNADAYAVPQTDSLCYYNVRLIRRRLNARYEGPTHEVIRVPSPPERLTSFRLRHHASGTHRAEKVGRDIALLRRALKKEPRNPRYLFYLAQTYRDAGRPAEALRWYQARVAEGGYQEETWYAQYMIARCHQALGHESDLVAAVRAAQAMRPSRAEPLVLLARHFEEQGDVEQAFQIAREAAAIPYPATDSLFIEPEVYRSGCLGLLLRTGLALADPEARQTGRAACYRLAVQREAAPVPRAYARHAAGLYAGNAEQLFPGFQAIRLDPPVPPGYAPLNPSIAAAGGELHCVVRTANYYISGRQFFTEDGTIRSENLILRLDPALEIREAHPLTVVEGDTPPSYPSSIRGFEDCRLFFWRDGWWCTATVRDRHPAELCQIALLRILPDDTVRQVRLLDSPEPDRHQKNWMPLVRADELFLIYSLDPTRVLRVDPVSLAAETYCESTPVPELTSLRGGSQAVRVGDYWLVAVHEVILADDHRRIYLHRLVALDDQFRVAGYSDPFFFRTRGIEFCAGMAIHPGTGELLLSFGQSDCQAWIGRMPSDSALASMTWVQDPL